MNTQKPSRVERREDGWLRIHSIFDTIQGEGPFAGRPATFIRLTGCNLQCPMCDTEYTEEYFFGPPEDLHSLITIGFPFRRLIVITGGEPFRQNITPFVNLLALAGYTVQVETNGTLPPPENFPWGQVTVVCSPKTGKINEDVRINANAFKYVLSHDDVAVDGLPIHALGHPLGLKPCVARPPLLSRAKIYVQPADTGHVSLNSKNMKACVASVMEHGYTLSVQIHKIVGLP